MSSRTKKIAAGAIVVAALLGAAILYANSQPLTVEEGRARVLYLSQLGWDTLTPGTHADFCEREKDADLRGVMLAQHRDEAAANQTILDETGLSADQVARITVQVARQECGL